LRFLIVSSLLVNCRAYHRITFIIALQRHFTLYESTIHVEQGTVATLEVRRAELTMETDGALADISAQHEQEVQNHSKSVQ
jgi:hypothetical protein